MVTVKLRLSSSSLVPADSGALSALLQDFVPLHPSPYRRSTLLFINVRAQSRVPVPRPHPCVRVWLGYARARGRAGTGRVKLRNSVKNGLQND